MQFPQLDHLIHAFLNQDYELSGNTIQEVVLTYKSSCPPNDHQQLLRDIDLFSKIYQNDLDRAFSETYGYDFDPALWEHTTSSFFKEVIGIINRLDH